MTDEEKRIWYATFGASYALTYDAMQKEPNTRYPNLYALHRAEHIALCAVEDLREARKPRLQSENAELRREVEALPATTQTGICPNCGYGPVIALPPPPDQPQRAPTAEPPPAPRRR